MRVGRIPYINCYPVYGAIDRGIVPLDAQLVDGVPTALNHAMAAGRLDVNVRKYRKPRDDGWDARQIALIRNSGVNPFEAQDVDFFLAFPNETIANAVGAQLRSEGFNVEIRSVSDSVSHPVVLDVRQRMQLAVPQMQALSSRFRSLADANGGRYDSWSAAGVKSAE